MASGVCAGGLYGRVGKLGSSVNSGWVKQAVRTRAACGPACNEARWQHQFPSRMHGGRNRELLGMRRGATHGREAGGDLNVDAARQDEHRVEVIANGLELWGGAQLAVDTTLVSFLMVAGPWSRVSSGGPSQVSGCRKRTQGPPNAVLATACCTATDDIFVFRGPVSGSPKTSRRCLPGPTEALLPHHWRGPWRLPNAGSCQRTSARTSCRSGASPATLHSPASGSSSKHAATARCAATASSPD